MNIPGIKRRRRKRFMRRFSYFLEKYKTAMACGIGLFLEGRGETASIADG
jgi:hypothetical protein